MKQDDLFDEKYYEIFKYLQLRNQSTFKPYYVAVSIQVLVLDNLF